MIVYALFDGIVPIHPFPLIHLLYIQFLTFFTIFTTFPIILRSKNNFLVAPSTCFNTHIHNLLRSFTWNTPQPSIVIPRYYTHTMFMFFIIFSSFFHHFLLRFLMHFEAFPLASIPLYIIFLRPILMKLPIYTHLPLPSLHYHIYLYMTVYIPI